jgi:hypothetical protein
MAPGGEEACVEPVRIKLYGLVPMTRKRYLCQQAVAVGLTFVLLYVWYLMPGPDAFRPPPPALGKGDGIKGPIAPEPPEELPPALVSFYRIVERFPWLVALFERLPWLVALLWLLIAIETAIVLRMFARKEAEQTAGQAVPPPSAENP